MVDGVGQLSWGLLTLHAMYDFATCVYKFLLCRREQYATIIYEGLCYKYCSNVAYMFL